MKEKILAALKQRYKNLGVSDDAFDRVAEAVETVVTDENLESFVAAAEGMLKQYQGEGDRARTERDAAKREADELRAKLTELEGKKDPDPDKPNIAAIVKQAVEEATKPLQDKISTLEHNNSLEEAVNNAKASFFANEYVKKYKDEGDDAWERAIEINEAQGGKMTAEELSAKALSYFNKTVSRIGVDTSKPFVADKHDDEGTTDWSAEKKRLQEEGRLPAEE
jgi:predicted metal-dependent hydrolase